MIDKEPLGMSLPIRLAGDLLLERGYSPEEASLFGLTERPGLRLKRRTSKDRRKTKGARAARRTNRRKNHK